MSRADDAGMDVGFEYVPRSTCADWRAAVRDGAGVAEVARSTSWGYKTVRRHLYGYRQCSHDAHESHPDALAPQPDGSTAVGSKRMDAVCEALADALDRNIGDCATFSAGGLKRDGKLDMLPNRVSGALATLAEGDGARGFAVECVNPDANRPRFQVREVAGDD